MSWAVAVIGVVLAAMLFFQHRIAYVIERWWLSRWAIVEGLTNDEHELLESMLATVGAASRATRPLRGETPESLRARIKHVKEWRRFRADPRGWRKRRLRALADPWLAGMIPHEVKDRLHSLIERDTMGAALLIEDDDALRRWIFDAVASAATERKP